MFQTAPLCAPGLNPTVTQQIAAVKPKLNPVIAKKVERNPLQKFIVEQNDMTLQHGEIFARALDHQREGIYEIDKKVSITNGRVTDAEAKLKIADAKLTAHDLELKTYRDKTAKWRARMTWLVGLGIPVLYPLAGVFWKYLLMKIGFHISP